MRDSLPRGKVTGMSRGTLSPPSTEGYTSTPLVCLRDVYRDKINFEFLNLSLKCDSVVILLSFSYTRMLKRRYPSTAQWSLYVPHSGHYMYHQFNIQQFHVLPTQCIYVFCVDLRTNSHYFPIQH